MLHLGTYEKPHSADVTGDGPDQSSFGFPLQHDAHGRTSVVPTWDFGFGTLEEIFGYPVSRIRPDMTLTYSQSSSRGHATIAFKHVSGEAKRKARKVFAL